MIQSEAKAALVSVSVAGPDRWLATFDLEGSVCVFLVQRQRDGLSVGDVHQDDDIPDAPERDLPNGWRERLVQAVSDALLNCTLFGPIHYDASITDVDFDESVSGASMEDLFFVDGSMRGRELFDTLFAHACARVVGIEDLSDYMELASLADELWEVADAMERVVASERPQNLVQAVRDVSAAFQNAEVDDDGLVVRPDYIPEIGDALKALEESADEYFRLRRAAQSVDGR